MANKLLRVALACSIGYQILPGINVLSAQEAKTDWAAVVRTTPNDPEAWRNLGEIFFDSGQHEKALPCYTRAIELGLKDPLAFYKQGSAFVILGKHKDAKASLDRALELNPKFIEALGLKAECSNHLGEWQDAIADCSRIIEFEPKLPYGYGMRGTIYLENQQYEEGTRDVMQAMQLNPGDAGVAYRPNTTEKLSAAALAHGDKQVRQMLRDRPTMAKYVTRGDGIWTWAARKFAGEDLGTPIDWDAASPGPVLGLSFAAMGNQHARIQIADLDGNLPNSPTRTFEELWVTVVFELHNVASSDQWQKVDEKAKNGLMNQDDFIRARFKIEEPAIQQTRAFYLKYYLPWLQFKHPTISSSSPDLWYCDRFPPSDFAKEAQWRTMPSWSVFVEMYHFLRGQGKYERADYEQAIGHFSGALAVSPKNAEARFMRGLAFSLSGNPQSATEDFSKLLNVPDYAAHAYLRRGVARQMLEQFDKSLPDFDEAIRLEPNFAEAFYHRATEFIRRGDEQNGMKDLAEAIKLDPENPEFLWYSGTIRLRKDDYSLAAADYSAAIKLDPEYAAAYLGRGYSWSSQREFAKALVDYNRAIDLEPEYIDNYIYRAETFVSMGDLDAALKDLDHAIELQPENSEAYQRRGGAWIKKKNYSKAVQDLSKAIELAPENAEIYAERANLFLDSEDSIYLRPAQAIQDATKSCELTESKNPKLITLLAKAYAASGEYDAAISWQSKAIELSSPEESKGRAADLETYKKLRTLKEVVP